MQRLQTGLPVVMMMMGKITPSSEVGQRFQVWLYTGDSHGHYFQSVQTRKANKSAMRCIHHPAGHTEVLFSALDFIYSLFYDYYSSLAPHCTFPTPSRAAGSYGMNHDHLYSDNILCSFFIILLPLKPLSSISL